MRKTKESDSVRPGRCGITPAPTETKRKGVKPVQSEDIKSDRIKQEWINEIKESFEENISFFEQENHLSREKAIRLIAKEKIFDDHYYPLDPAGENMRFAHLQYDPIKDRFYWWISK